MNVVQEVNNFNNICHHENLQTGLENVFNVI